MTERKKTVKDLRGQSVSGVVVGIAESVERFSVITLEDGTILKTKLTAIEAIRLDGQWDSDGNPVYNLRSQNIVVIDESPEKLKKKVP